MKRGIAEPPESDAREEAPVDDVSDDSGSAEDDVDSSDEEASRNRVGSIPMQWYDEFDHIGYDEHGIPIAKGPDWERHRDAAERFLAQKDDPDHWRKFYDAVNDREVTLTDADVEVLNSFMSRRVRNELKIANYAPLPFAY